MNEHLKLNYKLDKYSVPKSDIYIIIPDMQIKSSFKEKTKILKRTLKNGLTIASITVIIEVEEVDT